MKRKAPEWQETTVEFFINEILERYWKHLPGTLEKIIEIQYLPALISGEPDYRAFIGYRIQPWCTYASEKSKDIKHKLLESQGIDGLREYEKNYALGLLMTLEGQADVAPFGQGNTETYDILLNSCFGYTYQESEFNIVLWYSRNSDGEIVVSLPGSDDYEKPDTERLVRVRVWDYQDFLEIIEYFQKHNKFPKFIKNQDLL
jgi:hypothetical protein